MIQNFPAKKITLYSVLGVLLFVAQISLRLIPNVELVSVLVFFYAKNYKLYSLFPIYIFVLLEGLVYGFGLWWFGYLYVWTILALVTIYTSKSDNKNSNMFNTIKCATILGGFGLLFGILFSPIYLITGGVNQMISFISSGLMFDLIHFVSNAIIGIILYLPLDKLFTQLSIKYLSI